MNQKDFTSIFRLTIISDRSDCYVSFVFRSSWFCVQAAPAGLNLCVTAGHSQAASGLTWQISRQRSEPPEGGTTNTNSQFQSWQSTIAMLFLILSVAFRPFLRPFQVPSFSLRLKSGDAAEKNPPQSPFKKGGGEVFAV
ncbi:MAG: hypothetical protein B6245_04835 [Desulfobacteraceae bacterium 4572_88]|nr:MAG: hypothetical protein B6245_04835 [Desulfobacteraceae bacterium 4572_88]RLC21730.1 MAG: hypothetical protein DRI57_01620 [Deltaproteobacteria bacterium]